HGPRSVNEVAGFYQAADVFALTSMREPYGTVLGEALAAGLPVVGWDAGNLPHLAANGRRGVILPLGDVAGLAVALEELATNDERREAMAGAAGRRGSSLPTWDDTA